VTVGYRDAPHLIACLESVERSVPAGLAEVLVVLNQPTDELLARLAARFPALRSWRFRANLGFGRAANFAAEHAIGEYLVLLNDDCTVEPRWLESLIDLARRRPDAGAVGSTLLNVDGTIQEAGSILWADGISRGVGRGSPTNEWDFERRTDYCSAASLLVPRDRWRAIGGFEDDYFPGYYEDVDLALKLAERGWATWYQPRSIALHVGSSSTTLRYRLFVSDGNRERFRARWSTALARCEPAPQVEASVWRAMGRPLRVLVIDDRVPRASAGSGYGRARDALRTLAASPGLFVTLHPVDGVDPHDDDLARRGVRIVTDLATQLAQPNAGYDVVVVSRPHNARALAPLIDAYLPHARYVYDCESLFHERIAQQIELTDPGPIRDQLQAEHDAMRRLELTQVARADAVVTIRERDARLLRPHTSGDVAVIEPLLSDVEPTAAPFGTRADIGFVAGWAAGPASPNADGLLWFAREVLPAVRADAPGCRLLVTGARPPSSVRWMDGPDVRFLGEVPDLRDFYGRISVAVAPIRFGAGVNIKTAEALQFGVPVVATSAGAAGLAEDRDDAVWVADDPGAFARAILRLLSDRSEWQRRRQAGLDLVRNRRRRHDVAAWPAVVRAERLSSSGVAEGMSR
jgi:GT2 family glycosyltransferase/glycosyltransferase involved in cell wall biosynthesis